MATNRLNIYVNQFKMKISKITRGNTRENKYKYLR